MDYTFNQQIMKEKTFDFIYQCALYDAILQKSFKGKKDWISQLNKPKIILSQYIDKILKNEFSSQANHDKNFLGIANTICREINSSKPSGIETDVFSFGNAQKLINITVKHIYTFCYYEPSLRECFRFCHCPVDSIMLDKVWHLCKSKYDLGTNADFCKSWGAEGIVDNSQPELTDFPERYALFQKTIRRLIGNEDLFPIEFDYMVWK